MHGERVGNTRVVNKVKIKILLWIFMNVGI
jgi:hypothetical protein